MSCIRTYMASRSMNKIALVSQMLIWTVCQGIYIYIYIYIDFLDKEKNSDLFSTTVYSLSIGNSKKIFISQKFILNFSKSECSSFEQISNIKYSGGARDVMVIVVGNGHGDTSSNPGRD